MKRQIEWPYLEFSFFVTLNFVQLYDTSVGRPASGEYKKYKREPYS